jgi:hypothetical protein
LLTTTTVLPTAATTIPFQLAFNQAMALDPNQIKVTNGTIVGGVAGVKSIDGAVYTFDVSPTPIPNAPVVPVTVETPEGAALNAVGVRSPSTRLVFNWSAVPALKSFSQAQIGTTASYTVTLVFKEPVEGLDASKLVALGYVPPQPVPVVMSDLTGGGTTYNLIVTPLPTQGMFGSAMTPSFQIKPGSITSAAGVPIGDSVDNIVQFTTVPITGPTMIMTSTAPTKTTLAPIPVTVRFSEPVKNFTAATLNTINGTITNFQQPDAADASVYTFTLTPTAIGSTAAVPDMSGVVGLANDVPVMSAAAFNRNIASPVVNGVTSTASDGTYGVGDAIPIVVSFSAPVKVVGRPLMALNSRGSTLAAFAEFDRISSDGLKLTYIYKPAPGQMADRLNADSQVALAYRPQGAGILDAATNQPLSDDAIQVATAGPGSLVATRAITIDTGKVTSVLAVSSTKANGLYAVGATIPITVRFSRPVVVTGTPTLDLNIGPDPVTAKYMVGSGTDTLRFDFTVAGNQRSLHLDYDSVLALDPRGEKWTITDQAGNPISLVLPEPGSPGSLSFNKAIGVAGIGPRVRTIRNDAATTPNNSTFGIGRTLTLLVGFDTAVAVTGAPTLRLNSGGTAVYAAGTGTSTLTFTYTVAAGQQTPSLDAADPSALEGGTIRDFAGNDAIRTLPSPGAAGSLSNVSDNRNLRIAGVPPRALAVFTPVNGLRTDGGAIDLAVKFDAQLTKPTGGTPTLRLSNGGIATFTGLESDGKGAGNTLKFQYNPLNGVTTTKVAAASAGQPVTSTVINVDSTSGFPTSGRINVPTTTGVPASVVIAYTGITATSFTGCSLVFGASDAVIQTVGQVGNAVLDGRGLDAVSLDLNGATLKDVGGNDAVLTLPAAGAAGSLSASNNIVIKTNPYTPPLVVDVSSSIPFGTTLGAGAQVPITVTFSEPVTVAGTPELALSSGGAASTRQDPAAGCCRSSTRCQPGRTLLGSITQPRHR